MAVDFKTFSSVVPHVTRVKKPILLRGRHGVGKSQVVYQYAAAAGLPVVERRASQMTEGDLLGMPSPELAEVNGVGCSQFRPFAWLIQACTEPVVLFLDEVDRATLEVRQGIFELTDSRKIAGWVLHPETLIFAAVNGGEHGAQYQVGEMDPAELDRWTVFDVEPTTEDWLAWGKDNVDSLVWDFINTNRNHLEHAGEFEPNKVYPSRRSWDRLSECLVAAELLGADDAKANAGTIFNLAAAFVGFEAAVSLQDFIKTYEAQVTVENIIDDGQIDRTKDFGINDHSALVEKMEALEIFKAELSEDQIQNLADYFVSLPSEVAMKLWTVAGAEGNEVQNCIKLHQCTATSGVVVTSFIVEVLSGGQAS
jgi:hypothetical protein